MLWDKKIVTLKEKNLKAIKTAKKVGFTLLQILKVKCQIPPAENGTDICHQKNKKGDQKRQKRPNQTTKKLITTKKQTKNKMVITAEEDDWSKFCVRERIDVQKRDILSTINLIVIIRCVEF